MSEGRPDRSEARKHVGRLRPGSARQSHLEVTRRYVRSSRTLWRSVGAETLLTAPGRQDVDGLSETATAAWDLLTEPRTLDDLVGRLSDLFATPRDAVEPDVRSLLEQLVARGWVEVDDGDD